MSCCNCDFITVEDFYSRTNISQNVDSVNLGVAIRESQLKWIKPLFCDALYEEICEQLADDTLSAINADLMCYIKDIQVRYAFSDFLRLQPIRITKESVVRKVSNESEFVPFENINELAKWWREQAENYIAPMLKFMKDNVSLNPLYEGCDECEPTSNDTDWGIF